MAYFLDLFSPRTYEAFSQSDRNVSGFRRRHERAAGRVSNGDKLICYLTELSRWAAVLEVTSAAYIDETPRFYQADDPFVVRFKVEPLAVLPKEKAVPIKEPRVWDTLSFTKGNDPSSPRWTGKLRTSLAPLSEEDGRFLEELILRQLEGGIEYPVDQREYQKLITHRIRAVDREISVSVPEEADDAPPGTPERPPEVRESLRIQSLLAKIGEAMGFRIWLPRSDRQGVLAEWTPAANALLDVLPLNYDEVTIRTVEQIDVLWLKGRAIVRAFEVEHTTAIYSGILRMADLLALQPNMNIKLHIVAPGARREKVFQQLQRPVFSLLEQGALSERCTFLSYDSIEELARTKHLSYLSDSVLDEFEQEAE